MRSRHLLQHYNDVIMGAIASQITSLTIVCSVVYSDEDQGKHQSSASLAFVWGIHRGPVNSPHKWPVKRKKFPFDDVIMVYVCCLHPRKWDATKTRLRSSPNVLYFVHPYFTDVIWHLLNNTGLNIICLILSSTHPYSTACALIFRDRAEIYYHGCGTSYHKRISK